MRPRRSCTAASAAGFLSSFTNWSSDRWTASLTVWPTAAFGAGAAVVAAAVPATARPPRATTAAVERPTHRREREEVRCSFMGSTLEIGRARDDDVYGPLRGGARATIAGVRTNVSAPFRSPGRTTPYHPRHEPDGRGPAVTCGEDTA